MIELIDLELEGHLQPGTGILLMLDRENTAAGRFVLLDLEPGIVIGPEGHGTFSAVCRPTAIRDGNCGLAGGQQVVEPGERGIDILGRIRVAADSAVPGIDGEDRAMLTERVPRTRERQLDIFGTIEAGIRGEDDHAAGWLAMMRCQPCRRCTARP